MKCCTFLHHLLTCTIYLPAPFTLLHYFYFPAPFILYFVALFLLCCTIFTLLHHLSFTFLHYFYFPASFILYFLAFTFQTDKMSLGGIRTPTLRLENRSANHSAIWPAGTKLFFSLDPLLPQQLAVCV
jgi:hypothetical protein